MIQTKQPYLCYALSYKTEDRIMRALNRLILSCLVLLSIHATSATAACESNDCCSKMGGVHYCDSSAGRYVCKNGDYSTCYCTRHAVMNLQQISGCCIWQGGVFKIDEKGLVICNNGGVSELCSIQTLQNRAPK